MNGETTDMGETPELSGEAEEGRGGDEGLGDERRGEAFRLWIFRKKDLVCS
jgi:hypothetical protein